ncbi:MAG TPA: hypothetical protein VF668_11825 [Pyrinomonadaceae bacterium]|jgi:hypothetical protein
MSEDLDHTGDYSKRAEFDAFVRLAVALGPKLIELLTEVIKSNNQVETRLTRIERKLDLLFLREIQSALQVIDGLVKLESEAMKERHLTQAEAKLLNNLSLDASVTAGGRGGDYWSAQAHYGLSCIALLRGEEKDAGRFILKTFAICPKAARDELAKDLYEQVFAPRCKDIMGWHESEVEVLHVYAEQIRQLKREILKNRMKQVGWGGLAIANALINKNNRMNPGTHLAARQTTDVQAEIDSLKDTLNGIPTRESLLAELDRRLDERCREIAAELLGDKDSGKR